MMVQEDIIDRLRHYTGVSDPLAELPVEISGDLRALVEDAVEAAREGRDGAVGMLKAAIDACAGGDRGVRELSVHAEDGYAHQHAHRLLEGLITPEKHGSKPLETSSWTFGDERESMRLNHVQIARDDDASDTVLVDRGHKGAALHRPPQRRAADGSDCPIVGLDATARRNLWGLMLGYPVNIADVHDSYVERARFLRDQLGLQVIQTDDRPLPYEGDPSGKDLDADVALLQEIADQFAGAHTTDDGSEAVTVGNPACITTKCVKNVLEDDDRLQGVVSDWDNYGNITGDNDLGDHRLAAVLGSQHYGDAAVERMAAFAGEEVSRAGHGASLDYGSDVANTMLDYMQQDQTMQAILRFTRGQSGAVVFAHTSALRPDLPVVGQGQVVKSWNETATTIAREWRSIGGTFTVSDVAGSVDV